MHFRSMTITWERDGNIEWEEWWVQNHGHNRSKLPGLNDHIGYANYDLAANNCPKITTISGKLVVSHIPIISLQVVEEILHYHGFRIISVEDIPLLSV